jgi:hypothetical protein
MIQQTTTKTKKAKASYATWLILWGALWIAAYTACHFYGQLSGPIFTGRDIIGSIGSGLIGWWTKTKAPLPTSLNSGIASARWTFLERGSAHEMMVLLHHIRRKDPIMARRKTIRKVIVVPGRLVNIAVS